MNGLINAFLNFKICNYYRKDTVIFRKEMATGSHKKKKKKSPCLDFTGKFQKKSRADSKLTQTVPENWHTGNPSNLFYEAEIILVSISHGQMINKNYVAIPLMNVDIKVLNKILAN